MTRPRPGGLNKMTMNGLLHRAFPSNLQNRVDASPALIGELQLEGKGFKAGPYYLKTSRARVMS